MTEKEIKIVVDLALEKLNILVGNKNFLDKEEKKEVKNILGALLDLLDVVYKENIHSYLQKDTPPIIKAILDNAGRVPIRRNSTDIRIINSFICSIRSYMNHYGAT